MSFTSGSVTYTRLRVSGDAPASVDDTALSILREHAFKEREIGAPDEVEAGFITGEHLLDTQFSYEKNGFGASSDLLLFALRIDTHKVPADVKQAYRKINEQAAAEGNPSGFASKGQKRDAQELAGRQVNKDLAAGKFRRSKMVPLLWDLTNRCIYCGATSNAAIEALTRIMREAFHVYIELLSAGRLAGDLFRAAGRSRDWEDLHPSPFTAPPKDVPQDDADDVRDPRIPSVPWCAKGVDLKDFLGNEFLLWLWWLTETEEGQVGDRFVTIDRALDLDCAWGVGGKETMRGNGPTRWREASAALAVGKWPRKAGLIVSDGEHQWDLTLHGDRFDVSAIRLPEVSDAQSPRELTEARLQLVRQLDATLVRVFWEFVMQRGHRDWPKTRGKIAMWIKKR